MPTSNTNLPDHPEQTFVADSTHDRVHAAAGLPDPATRAATTAADETRTIVDPSAQPSMHPKANSPDRASDASYHLLQQIGQGGMGEVWEAEQTSLGRVIAVKRLRQKDGQEVIDDSFLNEAFHGESAIAASLEHPNILPVYDLGRDVDGTLLLAMKRVHGRPWKEQLLAEFSDTSVENFLTHHIPILMSVTQAVAFAHSRGIIHRDLKPAQVLVGAFGEVLLTDWGLAVQFGTDRKAAQSSVRTHAPTPDTATNPAGTPSMMAPEQTETHGGNLGPWTDVYLLGGMLYYLLTGSYPHAADSSEAAFAQARTGRVQPPGARAPDRTVPAELEQLCLKALEPQKDDRLPSAAAFLKGLQDYQRGTVRKEKSAALVVQVEQNLAGNEPDYAGYTSAIASLDEARRLWPDNPSVTPLRQRALHGSAQLAMKQGDLSFARLQCEAMDDSDQAAALRTDIAQRQHQVDRRRTMLRLATAAVFTLMVVIAGGALLFSSRMQAANKEIARHAQETEHALKIAEARSTGAFDLINYVLNDLKKAMDNELTPERGIAADAHNEIVHAIAGKVASPIVTYFGKAAPESWPQNMQLEQTRQMGKVAAHFRTMGRNDEAEKLLVPALALRETLPDQDSEDVGQLINELALTYDATGRIEKSMPLLRRLVASEESRGGPEAPEVGELLINLGTMHWRIGQLDKAEALLRRAVTIFEKHPEYELQDRLPHALSTLANVLAAEGHADDAEKLLRRALGIMEEQLGTNDVRLASTLNNLAEVLRKKQQYAEAEALYRRAITLVETAYWPDHPNIGALSLNMGVLLRQDHRDKEAGPWLHRALRIQQATAPKSPRTASALRELGYLDVDHGHYGKAEPLFRQSLDIYKSALGPDHRDVGITKYALGLLLQSTHRLPEARMTMQSAVEVLRKASGDEGSYTRAAQKALDEINASQGKSST